MEDEAVFAQWVILELMGHRRLAGWLTEQEIGGKGFLRLDIPGEPTNKIPAATQLYNPTAVYCITPTTEDIARRVALRDRPAPVSAWELPPAITADEEADEVRAAAGFDDDGPF